MEKNLTCRKNLINLLTNTTGFPLTINNITQVLNTGRDSFTSFFQAIKEAREHIHLEFYIFRDDHIGKEMQKLLIAKALQGVKVRLIYDGYGSRHLKKSFLEKFQESGIETACFSPIGFNNRINYRNHRKILIIDGKIGFVGGINIGDEYLGFSENFSGWRDTHLKIEGDAVKIL
ncbi:MAG: cardiolipin synthase, partial [Clostridia bacterium]|nr:cardiolipin synthase [Clostridia bacterium]